MTRPISDRPPSLPHVARPVGRGVTNDPARVANPTTRDAPGSPKDEGGFRAVLQTELVRLSEGERAMESMVRGSLAGRTLGTAELLAMQAGVYRYGQEIELLSRLVDRASSAVKQTLQSQT